jgi:biopolymer transport protein ExbD
MAVKIKKFRRATEDLNMSSISDIVFLLLIYFMVVTVFQQDIGMPFVLPAAQDNQDQTVKIKESNIADLTIDANDLVFLDDVPLQVNQIKNRLELRLRENPKLVVMVNNHPTASYGIFTAVLDEVRLAECRRVAIKMQEG